MDQDSVVYPDIIEKFKNYISIEGIASITSLRKDRRYPVQVNAADVPAQPINKCITSGNMVRAEAWKAVGGFNEKLFIDMVDSEFCYRLRMAGYQIQCVNKVEITHELGDAYQVSFLGRKRTILNHSAFRRYYIFRNTVYLLRKFPMAHDDYSYSELLKTFIAIILFETEKISKARSAVKGFVDGLRM